MFWILLLLLLRHPKRFYWEKMKKPYPSPAPSRWPPRSLGQRIATTPPSSLNRQSQTSRAGPGIGGFGLEFWNRWNDMIFNTDTAVSSISHKFYQLHLVQWRSQKTRETREGWPLLTLETEANGDSKRTNERDPFLVGSLCLSCRCKFLFCLGCSSRPSTKYFVPHRTLFPNLCDHRPTSWACSRAGSPVS